MKTGEIWLAQLDPPVGSEIQKTRPCVVVSPDEMNAHLRTVIVAPMTTGSRPAGFRVPLTFQGKQGLIMLDQLRAQDVSVIAHRPNRLATAPDRFLTQKVGAAEIAVAIVPGSLVEREVMRPWPARHR